MSSAHDVEAGLSELAIDPPAALTETVLAEVGLGDADRFVEVDTPVGRCFVAFNRSGISALAHGARTPDAVAFARFFRSSFQRAVLRAQEPPPGLLRALRTGRANDLRYDLSGLTPFERAVLDKALEIPPGQVRPYSWVAAEIGRPRAVRAVGSALGGNPVPLLIPCHRVVRADNTIGEYAFGSEMKHALLDHEGVDLDALANLGRAGVRYVGSRTTKVYCHPTCAHATRIAVSNRVALASQNQAQDGGFRPCRVCRPTGAERASL